MKGKRPTNRDLDIALQASIDSGIKKDKKIDELVVMVKQLQIQINTLAAKINYYENPNSPSSANSLTWRQEKQERRQKRKDDQTEPRKPGGRQGHVGTSRRHSPSRTIHHNFQEIPKCDCGHAMVISENQTRDILDVQIMTTETRHITQTARCHCCNRTRHAPNDLPANGSYGKNVVGLIIQLRAAKIPFDTMPEIIQNTFDIHISKSTAINAVYRVADRMEQCTQDTIRDIQNSNFIHVDETGYSHNGKQVWVWGLTSGKNIAMIFNPSRNARVPDTYLDGYCGTIISDGYPVYKRFDPVGRHQICWAHELRNAKELAKKHGSAAKEMYDDLAILFEESKNMAQKNRCAKYRQCMESVMWDMLDKYRDIPDAHIEKLIKRLDRVRPNLFVFLQYPVDPTNNAAERALRYAVVFRKISGQIRGSESMRRISNLMTCILTWRAHGKSIVDEVMARI